MSDIEKIQLFGDKKVRTAWDEEEEKWYFSVVDVCGVLTDQPTPKRASTYWAVLKSRLKEEGANEVLTTCKQLKLIATDGKPRPTDVADTQTIFRIIQSIPAIGPKDLRGICNMPVNPIITIIDNIHLHTIYQIDVDVF